MTVAEVAEKCRVTQIVLQIEMHHGLLAFERVNGEVEISHEQMMNWTERRRDRIKAHHACRRSNRREITWQNRMARAKAESLSFEPVLDSPGSVADPDPFDS